MPIKNQNRSRKPSKTGELVGVDVPRLVGLVESAIRSTAGSMILDIHIEDELLEAITATITEEIGWGNDADRAMKSALEKVFSHHEERMIDAARDDVNGGKARALRSLPNATAQTPPDDGTKDHE